MIIGIPKEIKNHEYRLGTTPDMVKTLVDAGHRVLVQSDAGLPIGFTNKMFLASGAEILDSAAEIYEAQMIVKVKELQESEFKLVKEGQILFCYLHLAPDPIQTKHIIDNKIIAIAYETVTDAQGRLPLLVPMSEIAGRISIQVGATYLQMNNGGKGLLLGGVPGVRPAKVVVIGGGVSGTEAIRMSLGLGADVTVIDKNLDRLRTLDSLYGPNLKTIFSSPYAIEEALSGADLVIGAVLLPGQKAPRLITETMIQKMSPGSVFVDISIDQGGCSETSKPTTHDNPIYDVNGVIHYCVTNMPGACARTATQALTNATNEYVFLIANKGYKEALKDNASLRSGLNAYRGHITNFSVAQELNYPFIAPENILNFS